MAELLDLVIVGCGPAGLAALAEARTLGLTATLIDAFSQPGGQYYKQTPAALGRSLGAHHTPLLAGVQQRDVTLLTDTVVWGIFPHPDPHSDEDAAGQSLPPPLLERAYLLGLYGPAGTPRRLLARKLILAPGAHDRPAPFPGWTLPGVLTAGATLNLVKSQRVLPGRRFLLSGTGPLQLLLAQQISAGGGEVVAILDANPFPWRAWRYTATLWGQGARLAEGWAAWRTLHRDRVPLRWGQIIRRAEGDGQVERAIFGPCAGGPDETAAVDTICLGHGFVPAIQLARQAGCEHRYDPIQRAYLPVRDASLQTTQPGLFVVGDAAGIGGKDVAEWEGRLAALAAGAQLGRRVAARRFAIVQRQLAHQRRFAQTLLALFPASPHLDALPTDDTLLCRCEEVTAGDIRRAVADGADTLNAVRMVTRAGMGRCQGRMCGGPVAALIARELGAPIPAVGQVNPRPPVLPVPLDGLLAEDA